MRCMIVDDDVLSRNIVKYFIENTEYLKLSHICSNAIEASNILKTEEIDILYLDVEMPEMSGLELLAVLEKPVEVILITSVKDYAVEAFEYRVTDFLVKPVEYSRFLKATQKAKENIELQNRNNDKEDHFYVKSDFKIVKINFNELNFVEALADYVIINTTNNKYIVHSTMKGIEQKLPKNIFVRVHRSFIVNFNKIESIEDLSIKIDKKVIPIGASYKDNFMNKLNFL
jgi:DNA-binding LytR/AlgR family response regulator